MPPSPPPQPVPTKLPWVLVVDDEPSICRLIIDALALEAVEVVAANGGAAALRQVGEHATEPLLVLVDVLMPGMDGLTLARKLSAIIKRGKIVIMSGHLSDVSWWPADLRELTFVAKPFHMAVLAGFLREARLHAGDPS